MAKGEGAEQYSNASLLNKSDSTDAFKPARKVSLTLNVLKKASDIYDFCIFLLNQKAG